MAMHGCSADFFDSVRGNGDYIKSKINRYRTQKANAENRGISWEMSFEEWCNIWGDKWTMRGRNLGQYVMARNGDIGPYSQDNVRIITNTQNIYEREVNKDSSDEKLISDLKSQVGIDGEKKGVEFCTIYDDEWHDILYLIRLHDEFKFNKAGE